MSDILPKNCPSCSSPVYWDETETHLVCRNDECDAQLLNKLTSFFTTLEVDSVGEGICEKLYNAGYNNVVKVLDMSVEDLLDLEGFKTKMANKVYNNIHDKLKDVLLEKLQHASNMFSGLGSKKLKLLNEYNSPDRVPTSLEVMAIPGFSLISTNIYLDNIERFWEWATKLPVTIKETVEVAPSGTLCDGMVFVFTGVRDKDAMAQIESLGGTLGSSVSKKTTHLICKDKTSTSGKALKARDLGCVIWELEDLYELLKTA